MRTSKKIAIILICFTLLSANTTFATASAQTVSVYFKPDITIQVGDREMSFYDANGKAVFPLIYQGTTYLPVRAVAALMNENIEWDGKSKTVYIGRTLSNPSIVDVGVSRNAAREGGVPGFAKPPVQIVDAFIMREVLIMYDFEYQSFLDAVGRVVYPINYQGSNYLPIRAIARLMGESIEWDEGQKLITISNKNAEHIATEGENVKALRGYLTSVVKVFDEATIKIMSLNHALSEEELQALVPQASRDLLRVNRLINEIKHTDTDEFSEAELTAYSALLAYTESAGYYIQIIENIIYMAANDQDYSMFADTFMSFALDSQTKYEAARNAIRDL